MISQIIFRVQFTSRLRTTKWWGLDLQDAKHGGRECNVEEWTQCNESGGFRTVGPAAQDRGW